MKVKDFKTHNATFICGAYKVIVLSPIYLDLIRTLDYLLVKLLESETKGGKENNYALRTFVDYLAVDLQLSLQVLSLPLSVLKDSEKVFNESK